MQGEWDIEMADDDEGFSLILDDEQPASNNIGVEGSTTVQDILSGRRKC